MRIVLRTSTDENQERPVEPVSSPPLFSVLPGRRRFLPLCISLVLHTASVLFAVVGVAVQPRQAEEPKIVAKSLLIRLTPPVYTPAVKRKRRSRRARPRVRDLRSEAAEIIQKLRQNAKGAPDQLKEQPGVADVQKLDTPTEAILIQPRFPLEMRPPPTAEPVPTILLWAGPPKPTPARQAPLPASQRPAEASPAIEPPEMPSVLAQATAVTVPDLARPDTNLSQLAPAALPPRPDPLALPFTRSGAATESISLIAVSEALPTRNTIIVPPGNLVPSGRPSAPAQPGQIAASGSADKAKATSAPPSGNSATASPAPVPNAPVPVTRPTPAAPSPPLPPARTAEASAAERKSAARQARSAPPPAVAVTPPALTAVPVKGNSALGPLDHPPNGNFDVIIAQSVLDDAIPGLNGLLSGKPINTVYLRVGDTKDWTLHFCARDGGIVQSGVVYHLPDPRPIQAPYPRRTFRSAEPVSGESPYVLVHGVIDESGSFQNLKVVGPPRSGTASLLEALGQWKFRPATKGDTPAAVEMVLVIPVRKR